MFGLSLFGVFCVLCFFVGRVAFLGFVVFGFCCVFVFVLGFGAAGLVYWHVFLLLFAGCRCEHACDPPHFSKPLVSKGQMQPFEEGVF